MPPRNKVHYLPDELKEKLDEMLVKNHFTGYLSLSEWLENEGYSINKSSLQRYGKKFQSQLEGIRLAAEEAKAIAEVCGDDEAAMAEALSNLAQHKLFNLLKDVDPDPADIDLPKLVSAIASLNRSSVNVKKFAQEVKAKVQKTSEDVARVAVRGGLSDTAVDEIKRSILGIVD